MERRRVVITGMGAVTPVGNRLPRTWQAVRDGVCGIGPITQYDSSAQKVHLAAEVKDWDPGSALEGRDWRHMSRYAQLAMAAAQEAMADSGLDLEQTDRTRWGVIVSSGIGGIGMTEREELRCAQKGYDRASPYYIPMAIANMGAGLIAIAFGFQGHVHLPGDRLRRRHQRGGGRLPLHPGRVRRGDALRRRRGRGDAPVHRGLHLHAGPPRGGRPGPRLRPL